MKPKLLFLCQTLPFPPDGGVNIRSYNVLRLLARDFDVVMLCFYRAQDRPSAADVEAGIRGLSELARVEAFAIPQELSRPRLLWDHFRSIVRGRPYTHYAYLSSEFQDRLDHWLRAEDFAVAHVDSLDLVAYLPQLRELPIVCAHHNVESQLLRRRAAAETGRLRRRYIELQADLVEKTEAEWGDRVTLNTAVSANDRDDLARLAARGRYIIVPNGVDPEYFHPAPGPTEGLVFVGGANWFPNRDALEHFCASILPVLRDVGVDTTVRWIGRSSGAMQHLYATEHGVELTGYMEDVRPSVQRAACYVVPLRVGGGTRLKILDAWAMGKAIVSTSVGCEGLAAMDGENMLIRDDPTAFALAVRDVLNDSALRTQLERGARDIAEHVYSWEVIGQSMNRAYLDIADAARSAPLSLR